MSKSPRKTPRKAVAERVGADQPPQADFEEVLSLIDSARTRALAAVNTVPIDLYWQIGEYISHKIAAEGLGKGTVGALAEYIQRHQPARTGFSASNLWRMRQFFESYRVAPKLAPLVRELSWTHNLLILSRSKREEEREFYLRVCIREPWSLRELQRQLAGGLVRANRRFPVLKLRFFDVCGLKGGGARATASK